MNYKPSNRLLEMSTPCPPIIPSKPDSMIGITLGNSAVSSVPIYGAQGSGCNQLPTDYRSITSISSTISADQRDSTGQLIGDAIKGVISKLSICQTISQNSAEVQACTAKDSIFINGVSGEYNYYYTLYSYAITTLINALPATYSPPSPWTSQEDVIAAYQTAAVNLNRILNDITLIIQTIAQTRQTMNIPQITQQIGVLNQTLSSNSAALVNQYAILSKNNQNNMLLMKEMEQYSRQKAKYNDNLLMLYSFLNITALGLLFYIYRAS